jgi:hypothetical protein
VLLVGSLLGVQSGLEKAPHLDLLRLVLDLGFDATVIDSPHARNWPEPSSPDWAAEGFAPDPSSLSTKECYLEIIKAGYSLNSRWQLPRVDYLTQGSLR